MTPVQHVSRATYRQWLWRHVGPGARYSRLSYYDDFVARWPQLSDWFTAPLAQRTFDIDDPVAGQHPHGGANVIMPYLSFISLVHGVGLDYDVLFARTFAGPFTDSAAPTGLGVDLALFERHSNRLVQLGYTADCATTDLKAALGRLILHRGDPDLAAITAADITDMRCAADAFAEMLRHEPIREFYNRSRGKRLPADPVETFRHNVTSRINAAHLLLFTIGQVDTEPPGRVDAGSWTAHLSPVGTPPRMQVVIDRYLRLHLEAKLGREQSVRHFRDALRRLVLWLGESHPRSKASTSSPAST